jgi:hypothetical protein
MTRFREKEMALLQDRSPAEWYREAVRRYVTEHQACAACDARHCVFRSEGGGRVEYSCAACGFSVCHENRTSSYIAASGDEMDAERVPVITASKAS